MPAAGRSSASKQIHHKGTQARSFSVPSCRCAFVVNSACLRSRGLLLALLILALSGCAVPKPPPDAHVPPFARVPYEPISRESVVAIALREWRLFGEPVDDDPPGSRPPPAPEDKPEREPGLWQRVGEYWWLGMNAGAPESGWTGKHDASRRGVSQRIRMATMRGRPRSSPT